MSARQIMVAVNSTAITQLEAIIALVGGDIIGILQLTVVKV